MRKSVKLPFILIVFLFTLSTFIIFPDLQGFSFWRFQNVSLGPNYLIRKVSPSWNLEFKRGLDLVGGASITFRADMSDLPEGKREDALDAARATIERRTNMFGVAEPNIYTSTSEDDYRIIAEIPGISDTTSAIQVIGTTAKLTFWEESANEPQATPSAGAPVLIEQYIKNPLQTDLSGEDLEQASVVFDPNTGKPQVQLDFSDEGGRKFSEITSRNVGKPVAIVIDEFVISAPLVNEPISGGNAVISGDFSTEDAKILATQLNSGSLPVDLEVLEQHVVGPTLGDDSLRKSLFAGLIGFVTIVIFMTFIYKKYGVVACAALFLYILFSLAIFKLSSITPFAITLTLAGIAGFILSVGMAVDANILIFERTKEEERLGKGKKAAQEAGFSKAWPSIRDSNVSTLITCAILFQFGNGPVKGFAVVLALGVLISMFSAIFITRTILRISSDL